MATMVDVLRISAAAQVESSPKAAVDIARAPGGAWEK